MLCHQKEMMNEDGKIRKTLSSTKCLHHDFSIFVRVRHRDYEWLNKVILGIAHRKDEKRKDSAIVQ